MTVKKSVSILLILAILSTIFIYFIATRGERLVYTTVFSQKGSILQTVSETGTVKAVNELDLSFLNTGKLEKVYYKIGDTIKGGVVLAELDYSSLAISKQEAQANLDVTRANLSKLLAGATREEIVIAEASTRQAKIAYEVAKKELEKVTDTIEENIVQTKKIYSDLVSKTNEDVTTYEQAISGARLALNNTMSTYQQSIDNYKESALTIIEDKLNGILHWSSLQLWYSSFPPVYKLIPKAQKPVPTKIKKPKQPQA